MANKRILLADAKIYEYDPDTKAQLIVALAKKLREKPRQVRHRPGSCQLCRPIPK